MPELFLELFSEEIPARMQARGADDLARLLGEALAPLAPREAQTFYGPRRIAYAAEVADGVAESRQSERGPRSSAPEQAVAGFLRKHGAAREDLRQEGEFWVLERAVPGMDAARLIAREMPGVLRRFPWPKSMRWGGTSTFTWVRPLRRIVCVLDGAVVLFDLRQGEDDGHGLRSGDESEGHRFLSPGVFTVASVTQWAETLRARHVIVDAAERRGAVAEGAARVAAERGLSVGEDAGLLDEVAGLVEWPVPLLGRIGAEFMDLPPEVMQVSMRVNQRYFALRDAQGRAAPWFAFVANIPGAPDARAIVTGNERVLRARFSDARHFWDLDRQRTLESRVPDLDAVTFHAKLGSQGDRVRRIEKLAAILAPIVGSDPDHTWQAARLCKADLGSGMVGEFPELQGVMGRYYAVEQGLAETVADAIRDHYAPRGPDDALPSNSVAITVSLADKIDQIVAFFSIGEQPTGSGDPFALRRAALGIIRISRETLGLRLPLDPILDAAASAFSQKPDVREVRNFIFDRLKAQLRAEGASAHVLAAVLPRGKDDIFLNSALTGVVGGMLRMESGPNLLAAYRRAANILRIEDAHDGPHVGAVDRRGLVTPEEIALAEQLSEASPRVSEAMKLERFGEAIVTLSMLRPLVDAFFDQVTVNDPDPNLRSNRLRLLAQLRDTMNTVADFSKVEG